MNIHHHSQAGSVRPATIGAKPQPADLEVKQRSIANAAGYYQGYRPLTDAGCDWIKKRIDVGHGAFW